MGLGEQPVDLAFVNIVPEPIGGGYGKLGTAANVGAVDCIGTASDLFERLLMCRWYSNKYP